MAELGLAVVPDVVFNRLPAAVGIPDTLAGGTDGQNPTQPLDPAEARSQRGQIGVPLTFKAVEKPAAKGHRSPQQHPREDLKKTKNALSFLEFVTQFVLEPVGGVGKLRQGGAASLVFRTIPAAGRQ